MTPVLVKSFSYSTSMAAKLKSQDLATLVAVWYPFAAKEELLDLTYFVGWMFLVDDEIDQVSGPTSEDRTKFESLVRDTTDFVEYALGLKREGEELEDLYPGVDSFRRSGDALRASYTLGE